MAKPTDNTPHGDEFDDLDFLEDSHYDEDEDFDPELESLPAQINWLRPILMICVIASAIWVASKFQSELEYFLSSPEPAQLGEATELGEDERKPGWKPNIPHNTYVQLEGLPTRVSISCDPAVRYFKLVGAPVYVELPMEDDLSAIACRAKRKEQSPQVTQMTWFAGAGRAIDFEQMSERYLGLRTFYAQTYKKPFCADMTPASRKARVEFLEKVQRESYKAKHGNYPSQEELTKLLQDEAICHHAVLIQATRSPSTYWPYLVVYIVLGLIVLWNIFLIIQWTLRTRKLLAE